MYKNNKGFSYVEMILVLAIIAILIAMIGLSMGLVSRTNISKATSNLESAMNRARTTSMARGSDDGAIKITNIDGWYYYSIGGGEQVKLVAEPVSIGWYYGSDFVSLDSSGDSLTLKFVPSTGAFRAESVTGEYCTSIVLYNEDKSSSLILYPQTGKCEIDG